MKRIYLIIIAVIFLGMGVILGLKSRKPQTPPPISSPDLQIVDFNWYKGHLPEPVNNWWCIVVIGSVKNTGLKAIYELDIRANFYNRKGRIINVEVTSLSGLSAGESRAFIVTTPADALLAPYIFQAYRCQIVANWTDESLVRHTVSTQPKEKQAGKLDIWDEKSFER